MVFEFEFGDHASPDDPLKARLLHNTLMHNPAANPGTGSSSSSHTRLEKDGGDRPYAEDNASSFAAALNCYPYVWWGSTSNTYPTSSRPVEADRTE